MPRVKGACPRGGFSGAYTAAHVCLVTVIYLSIVGGRNETKGERYRCPDTNRRSKFLASPAITVPPTRATCTWNSGRPLLQVSTSSFLWYCQPIRSASTSAGNIFEKLLKQHSSQQSTANPSDKSKREPSGEAHDVPRIKISPNSDIFTPYTSTGVPKSA
ncbi:hypothetical protein BJV78DRAFT_429811 [Lactifluus subvellereus]|nr:hypothetical protein BJV78DRAFT_429811 [Lactifluus subvellereus]